MKGDPPKGSSDSESAGPGRWAKRRKSVAEDADSVRLLQFIFDSLCSLRAATAKLEQPYLCYLIEMAALEARNELNASQLASQTAVDVIEKGD